MKADFENDEDYEAFEKQEYARLNLLADLHNREVDERRKLKEVRD